LLFHASSHNIFVSTRYESCDGRKRERGRKKGEEEGEEKKKKRERKRSSQDKK
jgi:hypothetical protein